MPTTIQLRRGVESKLPTLAAGEPGFTTDTYKLFIGDGATNHQIGGNAGTVTSVDGSGGTTGLTVTGGPITSSGTLTIDGILIPENGGSGLDCSGVTDGQILIGQTSDNTFGLATITPGTGITITNAGHSITIDATATGDVTGPGSSTDNAIVRWDGTGGDTIQNSLAILDDSGNLDCGWIYSTYHSSATVTVPVVGVLEHETSNTPASGFGMTWLWRMETSTTASSDVWNQTITWLDATHASRTPQETRSLKDSVGWTEYMRAETDGSGAPMIGFFGANAVGQQTGGAATAGGTYTATEQAMLQAVYDAVRNIGIMT